MCFEWKPELGTRVMVIDRATLDVEALVTLPDPAPTCYHIINAFEEDADGGSVLSVQICEQVNGNRTELENQYMNMATAAFSPELQCRAVEYRLRLPAKGAAGSAACVQRIELAATAARPFELPEIHPQRIGRRLTTR